MTAKSFFSKIFTVTVIVILAITLCIPMAEEVHAAPKKVKVTFNVNGGKALSKAKKTKSITAGKKVGTLPKVTRKGYTFKGWYTKKSGGKKISKNTQIKKKTTYYARWTAKSYAVKFDANGGTTPTIQSKKVKYNARYGALPPTSRVGHDFQGWYTARTGGKKITANDINSVAANSTIYAQWLAKSYRVTFDANGGVAPTFQSKDVKHGSNYGALPTTNRAGHDFNGWYTAKTGGKEITANDVNLVGSNSTLYAQWSVDKTPRRTITYDPNGGTKPSFVTKTLGWYEDFGAFPTTTRHGYKLEGWVYDWYNDRSINSAQPVAFHAPANVTLFARWKPLDGTGIVLDVYDCDLVSVLTPVYVYDTRDNSGSGYTRHRSLMTLGNNEITLKAWNANDEAIIWDVGPIAFDLGYGFLDKNNVLCATSSDTVVRLFIPAKKDARYNNFSLSWKKSNM